MVSPEIASVSCLDAMEKPTSSHVLTSCAGRRSRHPPCPVTCFNCAAPGRVPGDSQSSPYARHSESSWRQILGSANEKGLADTRANTAPRQDFRQHLSRGHRGRARVVCTPSAAMASSPMSRADRTKSGSAMPRSREGESDRSHLSECRSARRQPITSLGGWQGRHPS